HYGIFLDQIIQNDILFSSGGDMMCYDENEVVYTNNYLHKKGIKTFLWGCSIGINNLTPAKIETLRKFSF
ncbi:polysaccharide pyruvyl transferase family protein, partial [Phocaeicola vulgatus]|nr:polysaccharide pyruvyl transferase family protein [Phocaeicola vulgatus]